MNIYGLTKQRLGDRLEQLGEKRAKAAALFRALYREGQPWEQAAAGFRPRTREKLEQAFTAGLPALTLQETGTDTCKYLFRLEDGHQVEAVLMRHPYGNGLCVSSQVGCSMGCAFCESGRLKKVRDLTAAEMVGQVVAAGRLSGLEVHQVMVMGIGEPMDNYGEVMTFLDILSDPHGLALGPRKLTVSTCGIVPRMQQFALREEACNLAVSLHAPTDALRSRLMPVNRAYPLEQVLEAARAYATGRRRVAFEYIMLKDVNDSLEQADQLARLLSGIRCFVNLIPYNPTGHSGFAPTPPEGVQAFYRRLRERGLCATVRHEYGGMVNAACGQLRARQREAEVHAE